MGKAADGNIVRNGRILVKNVEVSDLDVIAEADAGTNDDAPMAFNCLPLQIAEGRARMDQVTESDLIAVAIGNLLSDDICSFLIVHIPNSVMASAGNVQVSSSD